jgi:hypothetical protein
MEHGRRTKKQGGNAYVESWHWEDAVGDVLRRPKASPLVSRTSSLLRPVAQPYVLERYDDPDQFERLLGRRGWRRGTRLKS